MLHLLIKSDIVRHGLTAVVCLRRCPLVYMHLTRPQVPVVLSVTLTSFISQLVGVLMATDSFGEHTIAWALNPSAWAMNTSAWAMNGWRLLVVGFSGEQQAAELLLQAGC